MSDEEYERRAANRRANNALFAKWAREDRNQVIRELIEKVESEAKSTGIEYQYTWQAQVAWWLKAQMEGEWWISSTY